MKPFIGGPMEPSLDPEDPGAGEGDSYGEAAAALFRATTGGSEGAFKAALKAAVFALYREYEQGMESEDVEGTEDPGY